MPFVSVAEAFNLPVQDLDALALEAGEGPWRLALVGTSGLRLTFHGWPAGFATVPHRHPHAEEIFTVVSGRALFTIGDAPEREVGPGELVLALRGVRHLIRVGPEGPVVMLAAVAPNEDRPDETIEPA
jgi:mannose-6-phosphate isomerase-like protein (cupin superfamily)